MRYIVGCDIGTTSVKAVAFTLDGNILASENASYSMFHPEPGYAEQDPDTIFQETCNVLERLVGDIGLRPAGIAFSSAMHSLMALDGTGKPVSPLMIWADNRSGPLADRLRNSEEGRQQYRRTGIPIHAMTPACKLLWVLQETHSPYSGATKYTGIKDYVIFRLTGELVTDFSMAAAMGLLNLETLTWDEQTLSSLKINSEVLPRIVSPYFSSDIKDTNAGELLAGIPVITGGSDGCLANLGSGAMGADTLALTIGTSGAVRKTLRFRYLDRHMRTFCYPLDHDMFIVGGPTNNGGVVFQWLKDTFFADLSLDKMLEGVSGVSPGADGLVFFPYLLGERAPVWDSEARGVFHGIDIEHTRFHFARAVMEGILMNLLVIGKVLTEESTASVIYANGGFARSRVFVQMLADIFGMNVALNVTSDAGCIGAALVGLRALGEIGDFSEAKNFVKVKETVLFDPECHEIYLQLFSEFEKLLSGLPLRRTSRPANNFGDF